LVEFGQARSEVFHTDGSILVKVQAQVVVLNEDLHVGIGTAYVGHELLLTLIEHTNQHSNKVCCLIVIEDDFFGQLLDGGEKLRALTLHRLVLLNVLDVGICELVRLAGLDVLEALAALIQPQVKQILCNNFEALQDLTIGLNDSFIVLRLCFNLGLLP